ncbi:MAG: AI-2E family transporter [Kiloniellaceae bacterium]
MAMSAGPAPTGGNRVLTVAAVILATLAVLAALYFARTLFIPITVACVLALVLAPIVRLLCKLGLPRGLASAGVVLACGGLAAAVLIRLSTPAAEWFARLPEAMLRLRYTFREVVGALQNVKEITEDMARLSPGQDGGEVVVQGPDLAQIFLTNTGQLLTIVVVAAILLFFLLANGYLFLQKTVHILPTLREKKRAVEIGRDLQVEVSRYLLTITLINIGLGCVTAATMAAFRMPDPLLWGVMAATLNFIPYVGAILTAAAILLAAVLSFPSALEVFLPPLAFVALTVLEGNLVTPALVGRRLTLNPVIVFTCMLFWGWLWGVAGLLIAVPLLVVFKILCDHIAPLQIVGAYLSSLPPSPPARDGAGAAAPDGVQTK